MKLPAAQLDLATALLEFDVWITPSLGEIRDTQRFRTELNNVVELFEALAVATNDFEKEEDCNPQVLASTFCDLVRGVDADRARLMLEALASVLFLASGKSDNNAKCQLPIYLREHNWDKLPTISMRKSKTTKAVTKTFKQVSIPRVLNTTKYMDIVANLGEYQDQQTGLFASSGEADYRKQLLKEFIGFVLSDDSYVSQLWSIGRSYVMLKPLRKERDLLSPLVIFQVRGSVSASGGHDPEQLLRERLKEWGLQPEVDYNLSDVVLKANAGFITPVENPVSLEIANDETADDDSSTDDWASNVKEKTRAYDFVLPFRTPGWQPQIFIQSQFYAGDSGSVSHKNVDQTKTSRQNALSLVPNAKFVEYVDGAGYFSSLNRDLKSLLSMPTTASFAQVRTVAVRLRRELQQIGYVIPLEVEHAILRTDGSNAAVQGILLMEGYDISEIQRCLDDSLNRGIIDGSQSGTLLVRPERRDLVRRYLVMDVVAMRGAAPSLHEAKLTGSLLVPGYGPFYGMKLDSLAAEALRIAPVLRNDWSDPQVLMGDIRWLCDEGLAISR